MLQVVKSWVNSFFSSKREQSGEEVISRPAKYPRPAQPSLGMYYRKRDEIEREWEEQQKKAYHETTSSTVQRSENQPDFEKKFKKHTQMVIIFFKKS